jgi:MFS family permease
MFRSLRWRNYRLFFAGQFVSLIGTWLTSVAMSWLVYRLTGSIALMGTVAFAGQLPAFVLAPLAGVLVDRWDQHRVLVMTQTLSMLQSAALAVLALSHHITLADIIVLQIFQGLVNGLDMPARQTFLVRMVEDRNDLPNAIALNSSIFNAARALGPALAGVLIAAVGEGACFTIDAISYLFVIIALLAMRLKLRPMPQGHHNMLAELRQGLDYIRHSVTMRSIFLLLALVSLMGLPFTTFMPAFAKLLGCSAKGFGMLSAAPGVGALAGAIYLASRRTVVGLGRLIPQAAALFGVGLIVFGASGWFALSLAVLPLVGVGMILQMASSNTLLQVLADDDKRGRVMSVFTMVFTGMAPLGNLLGGHLAQHIGPRLTMVLGGAACVGGAVWFYLQLPAIRHQVRPIYLQRGLIVAEPDPHVGIPEGAGASMH